MFIVEIFMYPSELCVHTFLEVVSLTMVLLEVQCKYNVYHVILIYKMRSAYQSTMVLPSNTVIALFLSLYNGFGSWLENKTLSTLREMRYKFQYCP